jgi:serine/threonine-protein kinase
MSAVATDELAAGTILGNYRIDRLVGAGAMGQVYAASHVHLARPVALKVLAGELAAYPVLVQRFLREGRAAARVRHPHIIEIFDVGVANERPYLAMELLEGETLAWLFERGALPAADLAAVMLPVVAALATAHDAGVVHRDLKPDNVFLSRDAATRVRPVVLDFGLSKLADEAHLKLTETNALMGTPYYMSPEQAFDAKTVSAATDQYALGVMLYEGAVGRKPFEGNNLLEVFRKITAGAYKAPRAANAAVPDGLAKIIARAMSRTADARYPNLWELGSELIWLADPRDQQAWQPVFFRT